MLTPAQPATADPAVAPFPRPRGRTPKGCQWDAERGEWVEQAGGGVKEKGKRSRTSQASERSRSHKKGAAPFDSTTIPEQIGDLYYDMSGGPKTGLPEARVELVRLVNDFLNRGGSVDARSADSGQTLLQFLTDESAHIPPQVVETLLDAGADITGTPGQPSPLRNATNWYWRNDGWDGDGRTDEIVRLLLGIQERASNRFGAAAQPAVGDRAYTTFDGLRRWGMVEGAEFGCRAEGRIEVVTGRLRRWSI